MAFTARDIANFIPDYDGTQATLHDFITACDHAINYISDENAAHIPFLIKSKLTGAAKQFISSRALTDWSDIRNLLLSHFGDTRDAESILRELTTSFQRSAESPRSYVQKVQLLLTKLRNCTALDETLDRNTKAAMDLKHERIGLKTILSGLQDPIGQILRSQRPQTIEDATSILAEEENLQYLKSFRQLSVRDNNQKPAQIIPKTFRTENKIISKQCSYCQKPGHVANDCYKRQNLQPSQSISTSSFANKSHQPTVTGYGNRPPFTPRANGPIMQPSRPSVIQKAHVLDCSNDLNYLGEGHTIDGPSSPADPMDQIEKDLEL